MLALPVVPSLSNVACSCRPGDNIRCKCKLKRRLLCDYKIGFKKHCTTYMTCQVANWINIRHTLNHTKFHKIIQNKEDRLREFGTDPSSHPWLRELAHEAVLVERDEPAPHPRPQRRQRRRHRRHRHAHKILEPGQRA